MRPRTRRSCRTRSLMLRVESLEPRVVLSGSDITVPLDPALDQFGDQIMTVTAYNDGSNATFGIFDTGSSAVTFSADDQALFDFLGGAIPIKNPGGATADGIGGTITRDLSHACTILAH